MTMQPCLDCGEVSDGNRCIDHRRTELSRQQRGRDTRHVHYNGARWKNLSSRVRRLMPFCQDCGATTNLQADHIVPVKERPDWAHEVANLTTRCARCNGAKGDTMPAEEDIVIIERQIHARQTRGVEADVPQAPSYGKAEFALHTPGGYL